MQRSRGLPHEVVVDAEIGQPILERAGGGADRGASQRHHEEQFDQRAPEHPGRRTLCNWLEELVQLHPSVNLSQGDDGIP